MKKTYYLLFVILLLLISSFAKADSVIEELDLDFLQKGFQGIEWNASINDFSDMKLEPHGQTKGGRTGFFSEKTGRKIRYKDILFESISYSFSNSTIFYRASLYSPNVSESDFQGLKKDFDIRFGAPYKEGESYQKYFTWISNGVEIGLSYGPGNKLKLTFNPRFHPF